MNLKKIYTTNNKNEKKKKTKQKNTQRKIQTNHIEEKKISLII